METIKSKKVSIVLRPFSKDEQQKTNIKSGSIVI